MFRKKNDLEKKDARKISSTPDKKVLVKLTGFFDGKIANTIISEDDVTIEDSFPIVTLICTKIEMVIRLHFNEAKIENESILLTNKNSNIGIEAQKNQIAAAIELGFKRIELVAYGSGKELNDPNDGVFNGFITWAKFGYSMRKNQHIKFVNHMKKENRLERCISEIIFDAEFEKYWTNSGYHWRGEFLLKEKSLNEKLFDIYYNKKFTSPHMIALFNKVRSLFN